MTIDIKKLDRLFEPRSVAVVGDKKSMGYMWLNSLSTFRGPVYSVQIDEREIPGIEALGFQNYKSLKDVPGPVDFVVVAVPRKAAPYVLEDLISIDAGGATFFTSGFAETDTPEGIELQNRLQQRAREAEFPLVGPNCMGLFVPRLGIRFSVQQYAGESGRVGFIGQSGTQSMYFSLLGKVSGVLVSKLVSFGNAIVLDVPDYLEYLAQDPETHMVGMYVEGFKDGRRFFETLRKVTPRKPVVIWKGGLTPAGARAVHSHTASLATPRAIWDALVKQCGAIPVEGLDEMIDVLKALLYVQPSTGTRMGIMAMTGGQSVASADAFARAGLEVGPLSDGSYEELSKFFTVIGASYQNPLDISSNLPDLTILERICDILERDEKVDAIVTELTTTLLDRRESLGENYVERFLQILEAHHQRTSKPYFTCVFPVDQELKAVELRDRLQDRGIPSYPSFYRAANAYSKAVQYYKFRKELEQN